MTPYANVAWRISELPDGRIPAYIYGMNPFLSIAICLLSISGLMATVSAQSFVLRGVVTAADTKEPLSFVTVMTADRKVGIYTDDFGEYTLLLDRMPDSIYFDFPGGGDGYRDTLLTGLRDKWPRKSRVMTVDMPLRVVPPLWPMVTIITDQSMKKEARNKRRK